MNTLEIILLIINFGILIVISIPVLYFLTFSIFSLFFRQQKSELALEKKRPVTIIFPAYQEDNVILNSASAALKHQSKLAELDILVIADGLQSETVDTLRKLGARVEEIDNKERTKAAALEYAMQFIADSTEEMIILDIDNIMCEGFVDHILSTKINKGFRIVQGHRTAKNQNTPYAVLDAISEEINNSIFRRGHRVVGLSSALIGSGFICDISLFKEQFVGHVKSKGEDKEFELRLLLEGIKIGYDDRALVYDEKVQRSDAFYRQRKRWMAIQRDLQRIEAVNALKNLHRLRNIEYMNKLYQLMIPPKIMTIGIIILATVLTQLLSLYFQNELIRTIQISWFVLFIALLTTGVTSFPLRYLNKKMLLKAVIHLPNVLVLMIKARLNLKQIGNDFVHTKHEIE
jgi:cellulose synthase/poly-beta-1,6-N-acetylglucosamine synthase-like glycosyltransferase